MEAWFTGELDAGIISFSVKLVESLSVQVLLYGLLIWTLRFRSGVQAFMGCVVIATSSSVAFAMGGATAGGKDMGRRFLQAHSRWPA